MSLTLHLKTSSSPVRRWFRQRLGATRTVVRAANAHLRAGNRTPVNRIIEPVRAAPPIAPLGDRGLVGHAADWLLRLCLVDEPPDPGSAAGLGAHQIAMHDRRARALEVFSDATLRCQSLRPARGQLGGTEWRELCRLCLLLGWLERGSRAQLGAPKVLDVVGDARGLDRWLERLVRERDVEDLAQLGRAALEDHADLRDGRRLVANPMFGLSAALGGADADLIAGATLLDFKSTAATSIVGRIDLWQVVGYALADVGDEFGITDVGISALRWRRRITWPLAELLPALAGEPLSIGQARSEFRDLLT